MKLIPNPAEDVFAIPGNAFKLCGIGSVLADTFVGLPSDPMIVTKPPNKNLLNEFL